ncbi:MAG: hypothetical protein K0S12_819 [Bacteroidetes bacterium]|jgi:uncharacterized membrane protein YfcA|nr:hypothetical protein [Bacteroidota bacterium]
MDGYLILILLLPTMAFLYASVGHGGGSSYIILLTLLHFAPEEIKPSALILNIIISLIAFITYFNACIFPWRLLLALLLTSVPAAYLGGRINLDEYWYRKALGFILIFPVLGFSGLLPKINVSDVKPDLIKFLLIGMSIGFVSGIIGIGGGIILSPLLLIFKWTDIKQTAAVSAAFIFFNSIAGLAGNGFPLGHFNSDLIQLLPLSIIGGVTGAYIGATRMKPKGLRFLLTVVLMIASAKLMMG